MKLREFIERFLDGKTRVDIFDDWCTEEETVHFFGRVETLTRYPENMKELADRYVENIDVANNGYLSILVSKP